ncbi:hypothetical protein BO83DRAFT_457273 [Aspergillus eucalypticola CBS 122712]|uniref:Uncharacterized protein n=1 Tax=Aspergillus eucalypticola (strain CBS 122712 / IBT 29274) TaxID=1448314 RepID=A0A317W5T3_ASPEC|nr:uncharacterized protein BO83DRAFT_457273 [Aspergillus eucalypticola CBS 122712]PWY80991.1 hypothetical protein BO83DRAFT_457273 [Aspergillus eucalypticola CBS 122712]
MSRNFHPVNANSPSITTLTSDRDIDPPVEDNSNYKPIIQPYLFPPGVSTNTSFNSSDQTLVDNCSNIEVSQLVTEANRFWGNRSTTIPNIEASPSAAEYPATYMMGNYDHGYGDQNMHETSVPYCPCDHFQTAGTGMDMGMRMTGMKGEDENDMYNANQASMLAALGMTHLDEGGSHAVDDDAKTSSSVTVDDDPEWKEWKKWNETDANGGVRLPPEERMDRAGVAAWMDMGCEESKTNEGFMSSREKMDQAGVAAWLDMNREEDHGVFQHEEEDDYDEDDTTSYGSDDDMMEMGEETEYEEEEEVVNVVEGPSRQVLISSQTGAVAEYDTASFGCDFEAEEEEEEKQQNEERWGGDGQPRPSPFPCFYDARSGLIIELSSSESDAEETMSDPSSDNDVEETMSDPPSSSISSSSSPNSEAPQAYALPWPTSPSNLSTTTTTTTSSASASTSTSTPTESSPPPSSQPVHPPSTTPFTLLADLHTHLSSAPNHRATHLRNLANEISNTMYFVNSRTISGDFSAEDAAPVDRVMRIVREGELKMRYQERYERQKGNLVKRERRVAEREDRVSKREEMVSRREMVAAGWWEVWREKGREVWEGVEGEMDGGIGDGDGVRRNAMDTLQRTVRVTREVVRRMDRLIDESEVDVDGDCDAEGGVEL